jgi:hypothetical protein
VLPLKENMTTAMWDEAVPVNAPLEGLARQGAPGVGYFALPTTPLQARRLQSSRKGYLDFVFRLAPVTLWKSAMFKTISRPGESEPEFRLRLQQMARERRDFELDRLRQRYAGKLNTLRQRLMRSEQRIQRETEQFGEQKVQTAISVGATLLTALMGRKALSSSTLGRATTATRQASRIVREKQDIQRAQEEHEAVQAQIRELEQQLREEADRVAESCDPQKEMLQQIQIRANRQDLILQLFGILWVPFEHPEGREAVPLWGAELPR